MSSTEPVTDDPKAAASAVLAPRDDTPPVRRITKQVRELAAILWANGRDDQFILEELGLKPTQLQRLKRDEQWLEVAQGYRERQATVSANHRSRMLQMVEESYAALRQLLADDRNPKARLDAIKFVQEQAKVAEAPEVQKVDVNLGFQQNNIEVTQNIANIVGELADVLPELMAMDDRKHVREGDDALPQATLAQVGEAERRAEVIEADFGPAPDSDPDTAA